MAAPESSFGNLRFGPFELCPDTQELRKHGLPVKLSGQAIQVLIVLTNSPGKLVSREELKQKLWHPGTTGDFEHGLNAAINKLRETLSDSATTPTYVETLPGRGYRFIAKLEAPRADTSRQDVANLSAISIPEPPQAPAHGEKRWSVRRSIFFAFGGVGVAAALALWIGNRRLNPQPVLNAVPWNSLPGSAESPSFSPDGQMLTFQWDGNRTPWEPHVYVQTIDATSPPLDLSHRLVTIAPVWSPDGKWIAWGRWNPHGDSRPLEVVLTAAPNGGPEFVIRRVFDSVSLSWSPDSRYIALSDREKTDEPSAIFLYDRNTATSRRVTFPSHKIGPLGGDLNAVFSPDGRSIAFLRSPSTGINEIKLLLIASGQERTLLREFGTDWHTGVLAWHPDHKSLVYVSDRTGVSRLWRLPLNGGEPQALGFGDDASSVTISETAHRLAYTHTVFDSDIWRADIQDNGDVAQTKIISSSRRDFFPQLSPDESKLVFVSDRSGFDEIWIANVDGSNPVRLTSLQRHKTGTPRWSPNGQEIVFDSRASGNAAIYTVGINGSAPRRLTDDDHENSIPWWSPDGQWIYFMSTRTGTAQIWRIDAAGKQAARQVTTSGGIYPQLTSEGKSLYYVRFGRGLEFCEKDLAGGEEHVVFTSEMVADMQSWEVLAGKLYFTVASAEGWELDQLDLATAQTRKLLMLEGYARRRLEIDGPGIAVTRDGRHIYYTRVETERSNIMLVENFR